MSYINQLGIISKYINHLSSACIRLCSASSSEPRAPPTLNPSHHQNQCAAARSSLSPVKHTLSPIVQHTLNESRYQEYFIDNTRAGAHVGACKKYHESTKRISVQHTRFVREPARLTITISQVVIW